MAQKIPRVRAEALTVTTTGGPRGMGCSLIKRAIFRLNFRERDNG